MIIGVNFICTCNIIYKKNQQIEHYFVTNHICLKISIMFLYEIISIKVIIII